MSLKRSSNSTHSRKNFNPSVGAGGLAAPVITSITICDSSYNNLDDTALDPAGSYVKLNGTGFQTGCSVYFNNQSLTATFISSSEVRIQTPVITAGSYNLMLFNPNDNGGAIYLNLSVSNFPSWTTSAGSLGSVYEQTAYANTIVATGDTPLVYSVLSGTLPSGITLSSGGVLSGTTPVDASSTTYTFVANVKDAQGQDSTRTFTLTINVDTVTWNTPTQNYVISSYEYSPISNVTANATSAAGFGVLYSPNTLPSGISTNTQSGLISGTINTVGNYYTRYTATANTTGRSATRDVVFNVNQDVVSWSSPADATQYSLSGGTAMANVTLSASSAAGRTITYTANALPSGVLLSGSTIYGTPDTAQTVTTLLTATADTTNRSATRTISWSITLGDTYWKYTTLALNAVTPVTPFNMDSSNNNAQLIVGADARASNFNPYQDGYYSTYFNGSSSLYNTSCSIPIGTSDFTLEFWMYFTGADGTRYDILSSDSTAQIVFYRYSDNTFSFYWNTTNRISVSGFTLATYGNRWVHVALSKSGGSTKLFFNGTQVGSTYSDTNNYGTFTTMYLGSNGNSIYYLGYINNFRIVTGTGLYTSNFTPPTTPLTAIANTAFLTCQSNRFIDKSVRNFPITVNGTPVISTAQPFGTVYQANTQYYSTYFDGNGDYLSAPANTVFQLTGDFTVEAWVYMTTINSYNMVFGANNGASSDYFGIRSTTIELAIANAAYPAWSYTFATGIWYHVAVTRSSNELKAFVNGTQLTLSSGSATNSSQYFQSSAAMLVGRYGGTTPYYFTGNISNARIVKGTALYTSNFTPSTTPLTAISGTSLLTCQDSTFKDNSTNNFTVTGNGDTKPIAVSPFTPLGYTSTPITTYGSAYFDGTGDYIRLPASSNFSFPGDYTVEFWVYFLSISSSDMDLVSNYVSNVGTDWIIMHPANSTFQYYPSSAASYINGPTPIANRWYHVAAVRSGTTCTLYVDGLSYGSLTFSGTLGDATKSLYLGSRGGGAANFLNGYMSDVRITKTALYKSNFAPPLAPATPVANTQLLTAQTNGAHNNSTFKDESGFNNIITRTGNSTNGTFSPYGDNWSVYFSGSSDYISPASVTAPGTGAFTIEMWVNFNGADGTRYDLFALGGSAVLYKTTTNTLNWYIGADRITPAFTSATYGGKWTHIAITRDSSNNTRMFINGTQAGSTYASDTNNYTISGVTIGYNSGGSYWSGSISNFKMTNGVALYTASFTPSTTPLIADANTTLLTCNTNRFIDSGTGNRTITPTGSPKVQKFSPFGTAIVPKYYSTSFAGGSSDYLSVPTGSTNLDGTGDFTTEMWVYWRSMPTTGYQNICGNGNVNGTYGLYAANASSNTWSAPYKFKMNIASDGDHITGDTVIVAGQWYHLAHTRTSGLNRLFVNGVMQTNTYSDSTSRPYSGSAFLIGQNSNCLISNFRYIKGQSLYTGNFTPATSLLTSTSVGTSGANVASSITGTVGLLTCQDNKIVDNSTAVTLTTGTTAVKPLPLSPFTPPSANTGLTYDSSLFGGSMYFDGTGDKLTIANYPNLAFKANDFTIQGWFYTNAGSTEQTIATNGWSSYAPWLIRIDSTNTLRLNMSLDGGSWYVSEVSLGAVTVGQWYHVAVTRFNGTLYAFTNGVQQYTASVGSLYNGSQALNIGGRSDTNTPFNGYITDFQLINGKALYTSNFYPGPTPTTPVVYSNNSTAIANTAYSTLLVNGTSGGIIDQTRTVDLETVGDTKIAPEAPFEGSYYSALFNGSTDYIQVPSNAVFNQSGSWTVEAWVYFPSVQSNCYFLHSQVTAGWLQLGLDGSSKIFIDKSGTGAQVTASAAIVAGTWYHVAMVQNGTNVFLYINGVSQGSAAAGSAASSGVIRSGAYQNSGSVGSLFTNCYISNYRVTTSAVYSTTFTPSTTPLTAIVNTQLLTCQSNKFVDNSTNAVTLTLGGTPKVQTFNPFKRNTGQSYYFDGTGDYLSTTSNAVHSFGTGDFTVESWVYYTSKTNSGIFQIGSSVFPGTNGIGAGLDASTNWLLYYGNGSQTGTASGPVNGTWYHVAVVRSSGTTKMYVNGTSVISVSDTTNYTGTYLGIAGIYSTSYLMNGYISDLRITKGVARYTTTFTPPTTTFQVK